MAWHREAADFDCVFDELAIRAGPIGKGCGPRDSSVLKGLGLTGIEASGYRRGFRPSKKHVRRAGVEDLRMLHQLHQLAMDMPLTTLKL
jgi:hypothetical protein